MKPYATVLAAVSGIEAALSRQGRSGGTQTHVILSEAKEA
jgi:hypothetical protein